MKGLAISNSDLIRSVHNSFARSDPFVNEMQDPKSGKDEDVYHFIAYMPIHGALYELDGLSQGPVNLGNWMKRRGEWDCTDYFVVCVKWTSYHIGACDDDNWTSRANEAIQTRMARYSAAELHFSLMALTRDRLEMCEEQIEELDGLILSLPEDAVERKQLNNDRTALQHKLHMEQEKRARWHVSDGRCLCVSEIYHGFGGAHSTFLCLSFVERKHFAQAQFHSDDIQSTPHSC